MSRQITERELNELQPRIEAKVLKIFKDQYSTKMEKMKPFSWGDLIEVNIDYKITIATDIVFDEHKAK